MWWHREVEVGSDFGISAKSSPSDRESLTRHAGACQWLNLQPKLGWGKPQQLKLGYIVRSQSLAAIRAATASTDAQDSIKAATVAVKHTAPTAAGSSETAGAVVMIFMQNLLQ
jgi:hypothetical protein